MQEFLIIGALVFIVWYLVWISNRQAEWYMRYNKISTFYQELTLYLFTITASFFAFVLVKDYLAKLGILILSFLVTTYEFRKVIESIA